MGGNAHSLSVPWMIAGDFNRIWNPDGKSGGAAGRNGIHSRSVNCSFSMMKILVITDISVTWFYRYIGEISTDILEKKFDKQKIDQNSWKCEKTLD